MAWRGWVLASTLLVLLLAGMWRLTRPDPVIPPTVAEAAVLQSKADAACRCSRTGNRDQCWAEYRRDVGRFHHDEQEAACMGDSPVFDCFQGVLPDNAPLPPCVITRRPHDACSDAEVRIAEARRPNSSGCGG